MNGSGFSLREWDSLGPQLRVPFGSEGSDLSFLIHGSVNIEKGR